MKNIAMLGALAAAFVTFGANAEMRCPDGYVCAPQGSVVTGRSAGNPATARAAAKINVLNNHVDGVRMVVPGDSCAVLGGTASCDGGGVCACAMISGESRWYKIDLE